MNRVVMWWQSHFLTCELVVAVLLGMTFAVWAELYGGLVVVNELLKQNRGTVYGTLVSTFGALLGFIITAVSIVIALSALERLQELRRSAHYQTLWTVFTSTMRVLGLATMLAITALLVDRDAAPKCQLVYALVPIGVLAVFRVARCVWVLEKMISVIMQPSKARPGLGV